MGLVFAHAAHWLSALVYTAPVVLIALLFLVARVRGRAEGASAPVREGDETR